tara:strand:- start:1421 stop:2029 length:609 start_codon:yes stop_codon:yes gene_type:complete
MMAPLWEPPEALPACSFLLREKHWAAALLHEQNVLVYLHLCTSGPFKRKLFRFTSETEIPDRTSGAAGGPWSAKRLTEFHQCGVKRPGLIAVEQLSRPGPEPGLAPGGLDLLAPIKKAAQEPGDVRINDWGRIIKREARDSAGRVTANPGQGLQPLRGGREYPPVLSKDTLRCSLEVANTVIVTQTFPSSEEITFRGLSQRV